MEKTTVYLPKALRASLRRAARASGSSEAALIRQAIERATEEAPAPRPKLPLFNSGRDDLASRVDELLGGNGGTPAFGDR